jgi:hypothetical protein
MIARSLPLARPGPSIHTSRFRQWMVRTQHLLAGRQHAPQERHIRLLRLVEVAGSRYALRAGSVFERAVGLQHPRARAAAYLLRRISGHGSEDDRAT